ncbi:hypothetical protein [Gloeothece verrucosa]|uniref:Uncharacterized protein n=1 Tax=Gloeothece verrucosa (strain PCC 7822) TaxID=497965 RepID=E0U843_GLOV7|nr:hypothetical protein [Gloeothece verrucosa]ADN17248.1 hypothetical protein Cyan7822_5369 [Gloeothece verrucosa PCC 7822]
MLKQGPFIDTQGLLDNCQCYLNSKNISSSSIAGAAYDNGVLISLQNAPNFQSDSISVNFSENNQAFQIREIENLTDVAQANKIRRCYVPSPKHKRGGSGTYMDLTDVEAQAALDKGLPSGKQIYSFYNNKYYVFQNDNAGGFHGYPVDRQAVPPKIIKQLES